MKTRIYAGIVAATFVLTAMFGAEGVAKSPLVALQNPSTPRTGVVPGEVIVKFKAFTSRSRRAAARTQEGARFKRNLLLSNVQLVNVEKGTERAAAAAFERRGDVVYAVPNRFVHGAATPNDTRFGDLWGLHNTGQTVNGFTGTVDADIDATEGWNIGAGLGGGLRVADVDSGVALAHPDLAANIFRNPGESGGGKETNNVDDDGNGKIDDFRGWDFVNNDNEPADDHGHGSHTTGTAAARANNALGVSGVASFPTTGPWAGPKVIPIKTLDEQNAGTDADLLDGMRYAGIMGAKVANVSIVGPTSTPAEDDAIRQSPGTLFVIAAGNDGTNNDITPTSPCVPAATPDPPNKICVAATDSDDALASFSNFGTENVDLAAPGKSILSTLPRRTVLEDDFETPIAGRWVTNDAGQSGLHWGRTNIFSVSPSNSLTDSPGGTVSAPTKYQNNTDSWARNAVGLNLTGGTSCQAEAQAKIDTEDEFDHFSVEATRTPAVASSWQRLFRFNGAAQGRVTADLSAFDGQNGVFIRYRLTTDETVVHDGVYVDDVHVTCITPTPNTTSYGFSDGTSMATPHVTGAAAFLFARFPGATVAAVKNKILRSVDKKSSLTGKVGTGGRLNLYKAAAESTASVSSGVLTFTAGAGQTNRVTVTRFTDTDSVIKFRITDPWSTSATTPQAGSRINPGAGCARVTDNTVKCNAAGITRIVVNSGDLNDTVTAGTIATPLTINGGTGNDTLTSGSAGDILSGGLGADRFTAGGGSDTINARNDDVDTSFQCGESTGDSDTVNADASPNDPVAASPTNCEVVEKL